MPPAKQKPNDACACGSGAKHKKCCGLPHERHAAASAAAAAAAFSGAAPPGAAAVARRPAPRTAHVLAQDISRLMCESVTAEACCEYARALRRGAAALSVCAEAFCAGAPARDAGAHFTPQALHRVAELTARMGRLSTAEDCYARSLAITAPPHTFFVRAITCLSHAKWRHTPLGDDDVRLTLTPAVARALAPMLRHAHRVMGTVYEREGRGRDADALAAYERALEALQAEPRSGERDLAQAALLQRVGSLQQLMGAQEAALRCYLAARDVLQDASSEADAGARGVARAALVGTVAAESGEEEHAALVEEAWAQVEAAQGSGGVGTRGGGRGSAGGYAAWRVAEDAAVTLLRAALAAAAAAADAPARQRPWLLRAAAQPGAADKLRCGAARACRACAARAPPPGGGGGDDDHSSALRRCTRCARVAYCSPACQAADWRRHKRFCASSAAAAAASYMMSPEGAAAADAEALLADALCAVCAEALLQSDEHAHAAQAVELLGCEHFAHVACTATLRQGGAACPACAAGGARAAAAAAAARER
jgi:tetratricopeptide (TPR) repeat protein